MTSNTTDLRGRLATTRALLRDLDTEPLRGDLDAAIAARTAKRRELIDTLTTLESAAEAAADRAEDEQRAAVAARAIADAEAHASQANHAASCVPLIDRKIELVMSELVRLSELRVEAETACHTHVVALSTSGLEGPARMRRMATVDGRCEDMRLQQIVALIRQASPAVAISHEARVLALTECELRRVRTPVDPESTEVAEKDSIGWRGVFASAPAMVELDPLAAPRSAEWRRAEA